MFCTIAITHSNSTKCISQCFVSLLSHTATPHNIYQNVLYHCYHTQQLHKIYITMFCITAITHSNSTKYISQCFVPLLSHTATPHNNIYQNVLYHCYHTQQLHIIYITMFCTIAITHSNSTKYISECFVPLLSHTATPQNVYHNVLYHCYHTQQLHIIYIRMFCTIAITHSNSTNIAPYL